MLQGAKNETTKAEPHEEVFLLAHLEVDAVVAVPQLADLSS